MRQYYFPHLLNREQSAPSFQQTADAIVEKRFKKTTNAVGYSIYMAMRAKASKPQPEPKLAAARM